MLTVAERNSLLLSLGFLLCGGGIKAWKKWRVEIGPFDPGAVAGAAPGKAGTPAVPKDPLSPSSSEDSPGIAPSADLAAPAAPPDSVLAAPADLAAPGSRAETGKTPANRRIPPPKPPKSAPVCPVDLNAATEDRLAGLPGVGPRTAAAIAAYRKTRGPVRDMRELLEVKGIGEKKLARIAPCLILSEAGERTVPGQAQPDPEGDRETKAGGP